MFGRHDHIQHVSLEFLHHNENLVLVFEHIEQIDNARMMQSLNWASKKQFRFVNSYGENLNFMNKPVILILETFFIDLFDCNLERLSSMLRCVDYTKLSRAENFVVEYLDEYLNPPDLIKTVST